MYREQAELDTRHELTFIKKIQQITHDYNLKKKQSILSKHGDDYLYNETTANKIIYVFKELAEKAANEGKNYAILFTDVNFDINISSDIKDTFFGFTFFGFTFYKNNSIGFFLYKKLKSMGFKKINIGPSNIVKAYW
jgi:hypothetical protein